MLYHGVLFVNCSKLSIKHSICYSYYSHKPKLECDVVESFLWYRCSLCCIYCSINSPCNGFPHSCTDRTLPACTDSLCVAMESSTAERLCEAKRGGESCFRCTEQGRKRERKKREEEFILWLTHRLEMKYSCDMHQSELSPTLCMEFGSAAFTYWTLTQYQCVELFILMYCLWK